MTRIQRIITDFFTSLLSNFAAQKKLCSSATQQLCCLKEKLCSSVTQHLKKNFKKKTRSLLNGF
jgi:hypothetical protein